MKDIAATMRGEDAYQPFMLEPLEVIGVDAFEHDSIRVKVRIKTAPLKQWFVGREFRRRLNAAFQQKGVQMWSPQLTVNMSIPKSATPNAQATPNAELPKPPR
jgi:small conductance mechanosensitive channel